MAKKKEKQSVVFHFGIDAADGGFSLFNRRPKSLWGPACRITWFCRRIFRRHFPDLKFKKDDRGKVKITIEVLERE